MTQSELHNIPKFTELFEDTRFKEALVYLRANFPGKDEASGDEWRGYFAALDKLESLKRPPSANTGKAERSAPYTSSPYPENKKS